MIHEGKYMAVAVRVPDTQGTPKWARLKRTASGKPYVSVRLKITEEGPQQNQEIDWSGWLSTPKAITGTMTALQLMGLRSDDLHDLVLSDVSLDKPVRISIKHEEFQGVYSARVNYINAPNDEFDPGQLDMLAKRVQGAMGGESKKSKPAPKEPEPDDDLPW